MDFVNCILIAAAAYLLGSIPTGYLMARARGIDIRTVGSGNIGATNAFRVLGKPAGLFTLLADAFKGGLAVVWAAPFIVEKVSGTAATADALVWARILASACVVLGHNYTCWLGFKGGKGIATSAGVLAALVPWTFVISLGAWILLVALTRYVSVGSLAASISLPIATWFTLHDATLTALTGTMGALAIYKHRGNIQRLMNGTEPRIGQSKPAEAAK